MAAKEWAIPIVLGLVTAGALWVAVPQGDHGDDGHGETTDTGSRSASSSGPGNPAVALPFPEGSAIDKGTLTFLVLAPQGKAAALDAFNGSGFPSSAESLHWQTDRIAFYETEVAACPTPPPGMAISCDPPWAFGTWLLPKAGGLPESTSPRLGVDGHNGTRITAHVFDETGLLAATNAPENETLGFVGRSTPERLPGGVWYIGANATAPNGTRHIPSMARPLFQQLLPLMQGLPVGGVASVRSDAFASIYGTLYVTVRIDGLAHAP